MKKISFKGKKVYKTRFVLLGKIGRKWYFWTRFRTTYIIGDQGVLLPIKVEVVK